jgi:hypothetical protein
MFDAGVNVDWEKTKVHQNDAEVRFIKKCRNRQQDAGTFSLVKFSIM